MVLKIVFWSNVRGQCGTTLHTACMAVVHAMFAQKQVVIMENHDHLVNIESCFTGGQKKNIVREDGVYGMMGLENLLEMFDCAVPGTEERIIRKCAVSYAQDRIFYLPHASVSNTDIISYHFSKNTDKLFGCLEKCFGSVYVDAFSTDVLSAGALLEKADIIVVNLNQNNSVLRHFFRNFSAYRDKSIYLLGNYYHSNNNSVIEIRKKYQLPRNRIYAIPYCREVAEAESQGSVADFITANYLSPSINSREFINALHEAYNGIIKFYSSSSDSLSRRGLSRI